MSRFIENFRKKEAKNELSPDETAKLLRELQLDMMTYGVLGSNKEIPHSENSKAIILPHLLQYSPVILRHFDAFRGILHSPTKFSIAEMSAEKEQVDEGDVLYRQEGKNHIYYIGNHITSPFANPWELVLKQQPALYVSIMQNNYRKPSMWDISYYFNTLNYISRENVSSSSAYPERDMVLTFLYSPKQLSGKSLYGYMESADITKENISYMGEKTVDGFRRFTYHFDAPRVADMLDADEVKSFSHDENVRFLRDKGEIDFSIVEVGTVSLGGQKHFIYTGSEHAHLPTKQEKRSPLGALKPRFLFGNN